MSTKITKQLAMIEQVEGYASFRVFLIRVGFHSFEEYQQLFWNDHQKRLDAVKWFIDTYQLTQINY